MTPLLTVLMWLICNCSALANPVWNSRGSDRVSFYYVLFGNLLTAVLEAYIVTKCFKTRFKRTFLLFAAANYFSAFVGYLIIDSVIREFGPAIFFDIPYSLFSVVAVLLLMAYLLSLWLELPFVYFAFDKSVRSFRKAFLASFTAQCASYCILLPCYLLSADTSLFAHLQHESDFVKANDTVVYYIGSDGFIYKLQLNGGNPEKLNHAQVSLMSELLVSESEEQPKHWELWCSEKGILHLVVNDIGGPSKIVQGPDALGPDYHRIRGKENTELHGVEWGQVVNDYGDWHQTDLIDLKTNYSVGIQISGDHSGLYMDGAQRWNSCKTPRSYSLRNGSSQIFLIDLKSRQIARVARGLSPVVVSARNQFGHFNWNDTDTDLDR